MPGKHEFCISKSRNCEFWNVSPWTKQADLKLMKTKKKEREGEKKRAVPFYDVWDIMQKKARK